MTGAALAHVATDQLPTGLSAETASTAVAAQAKAAVEARYLVAFHRPRDIDRVRLRLLQACKRPAFAETARYSKPMGGGRIVGPSIRFAEEAGRSLGNILVETPTLYDDEEKRVLRVTVTDLESNLSYSADITLAKTVERLSLKRNQVALSSRTNSQGETTYLVAASEDDLLTKQQAAVSKHIRNGILRILPSDILEEAMETVIGTLKNEDAKDPAAARKKLVDAFFAQGVDPKALAEYLGHGLDTVTDAELVELRTVYAALKEGEARWAEILDVKQGAAEATTGTGKGTSALKDKLSKKAAEPTRESFEPMPEALTPTDDDLELDRRLAGEEEGR
ncbi:MAG: hypothetical protein AB7N73_16230 [Gemmatimonadales bacterium]